MLYIRLLSGIQPFLLLFAFSLRAEEATRDAFDRNVRPVLEDFCCRCHGEDTTESDLRLDVLDPDLVNGTDSETWHDVLDQVIQGEMPPRDAKQPTAQQRLQLTRWMSAALRGALDAKRARNGRVVTRRLTRYEYANTMRDLLLIELDYARDLPPDPASPEGFRNNGSTLEMSSSQVEQYLQIARRALSEAIVTGKRPKVYEFDQAETATGKLPTKKFAGREPVKPEFILDLNEFPRHGPFELKITARAAIPPGKGLPRMRVSMGNVPGIIHIPRGEIGEVDVSEKTETFTFHGRMEDFPQPGPISFGNSGFKGMIVMIDFVDSEGKELRYPDRKYAQKAAPLQKKNAKAEADTKPEKKSPTVPFGDRLEIEVTSAEFKAPLHASWPPPSHQRLMLSPNRSEQVISEQTIDESQTIVELLERFMESAFRRPVSQIEVEQVAKLFQTIRPKVDSFEQAVRETFAAVLISPNFLYIVENHNPKSDVQRVNNFELASRLSYFLWSSSPDQPLLDLAKQGKLTGSDVLAQQATRMLADERSSEFIRRFVGQWLDLDGLDRVAVNPEFFPNFDNGLKEHMRKETIAYFTEILQEDHSALDLLDSDWAMLNRPLANHYGLDGPRSTHFERVALPPENQRGGILGQGAFLLSNANGEDSHPIKRAVWILDRLLDSPPASPPPDVPELDADSPDFAKLTLKQQLEVHRSKESCGNCHRNIDPWGVPLENFDAVGAWRTEVPKVRKRPKTEVDAASILPSGTEIDGPGELKRYLVEEQSERFARSIVKRIMTYSIGRSLDFGDREAVDELSSRFAEHNFRLKAFLVDFVQSETFQAK